MNRLISLKIVNKTDKTIHSRTSRSKRRILQFIKANNFQECLYKIRVLYTDKMTNEGEYETNRDLLLALHAFTEKDL